MADLRVDIKTTADLSGSQAAQASLQAVTEAANQLTAASEQAATAAKAQTDAALALAAAQDQAATTAANEAATQEALQEASDRVALAQAKAEQATKDFDFALESEVQAAQAVVETQLELTSVTEAAAKQSANATAASAAAAKAASAAGEAAKNAAKGTSDLGNSFADLVKRGSPAHEVLDGILQSSLRSSSGLLALTRVATGVFRGFSAGGIGLFVTALAAAGAGALVLARNLGVVGKSADDIKKDFQAAQKEIERLAASNFKITQQSMKDLGAEVDRETAKFAALQAAQERVNNAEQAAQLAKNRNNTKITEEQRTVNETKIREDFRKRGEDQVVAKKQLDVTEAQKTLTSTQQISSPLESEFKKAVQDFNELTLRQGKQEVADQALAEARGKNNSFGTSSQVSKEVLDAIRARNNIKTVSPEELELARTRVLELQKGIDSDRAATDAAKERLNVAQEALRQEKATQQKEDEFHRQELKADLTPELIKNRQTDREKAAAKLKEQSGDPRAEKITNQIGANNEQIKDLEDQSRSNFQGSRSPENQARQAQIDKLKDQNNDLSSQKDALDRIPSKPDLLRSDTKAAKKDADKALDTKPIEDAETKRSANEDKSAKSDNDAIKAVGNTINGLPIPPPIDTNPLKEGIIIYNGKILELQRQTNANFISLSKTVRDLGNQVDALARAQSQQN